MRPSNVSSVSTSMLASSVLRDVVVAGYVDIRTRHGQRFGALRTERGNIHVAPKGQAGEIDTQSGRVFVGACSAVGNVRGNSGNVTLAMRASAAAIRTISGGIEICDGARTRDLISESGGIRLWGNVQVQGNIRTARGNISIGRGSRVTGDVVTLSGNIKLKGCRVEGGIRNELDVVQMDHSGHQAGLSRVVICAGVLVDGPLQFARPVRLYVHCSARTGQVAGAEAIAFATRKAPRD